MLNNFQELKSFWHYEILGEDKPFSWFKLFRRVRRNNSYNCLFWLRLSQYLDTSSRRSVHSIAKQINKSLTRKFGVEIMLGAQIDKGLWLGHPIAIVIYSGVVIGRNCTIRQCTTIGTVEANNKAITLGENVDIGAHTCIIGSDLTIGDNVIIGAMSFINKDVPSNVTYITRKENQFHSNEP
tara:strand:+ start:31218 stop:31763 length:546 start_codon:yes stop_codon:yes gene_type:complete